ncbi:MAG: hypothetical protein VX230_05710 [Candidatus Thermoplasmatota archaeon]|nr:hypothetical protein [Candidatus Thermoplasmatota archaeon]
MAKKDEEIEGMFTLVGDPDDPDLQAANEGKLSLTDRIKKMKKKVFRDDFEPSEEERDIADQAYLRAQQVISRVTPTRVVLASVFMAALMFSVFALGFWVVPRDAVNVEVVYKQGGPGHVVLIQVHNFGSRPIANVELDASFSNQDGEVLNSTNFAIGSILAHTSVAGDNLELVITGESIWELYNIEITLDYDNYDGAVSKQSWIIEVGEYTFESHMLDAKRTWL